jgi:NTE family protein
VSVGALNGAMVAQNKSCQLAEIWAKLTQKDVYKCPSKLRLLWNVIVKGSKCLYDIAPLRKTIAKHVKLEDTVIPFHIGVTSLKTGEYHSLTVEDFDTNEDYLNAIFASSIMPILWEPTSVMTKSGEIQQAVDGGLRNVTPLSDVLDSMPDHIYIVPCTDGTVLPKYSGNLVKVAERTFMDIMLNEIISNDIREFMNINELVLQASRNGFVLRKPNGKIYKYFGATVLKPEGKLGSPTDFSTKHIDEAFKKGYNLAKVNL